MNVVGCSTCARREHWLSCTWPVQVSVAEAAGSFGPAQPAKRRRSAGGRSRRADGWNVGGLGGHQLGVDRRGDHSLDRGLAAGYFSMLKVQYLSFVIFNPSNQARYYGLLI